MSTPAASNLQRQSQPTAWVQTEPRVMVADGRQRPAERTLGLPAVASMLDREVAGERVKIIRRPARAATGQFTPVAKALKACVVCGAEFTRRTKNDRQNICCSRKCGFEHLRNTRWAKKPEEVKAVDPTLIDHPRPMTVRVCKHCGRVFIRPYGATGGYGFCSSECQDGSRKESRKKAAKAHRRKFGSDSSHRKRARKFGCVIGPVNRIKVFEECRWTCCACGQSTPRSALGTQLPSAPELDHIIPLSKGGAHVRANVQLLCRACNGAKGSAIIAARPAEVSPPHGTLNLYNLTA